MIISRTPLRLGLAGGGTDFAEFYRTSSGAAVSTAIDKFIYVAVNRCADGELLLRYSKTEQVDRVEEVQHPILRECLKKTGVKSGVEVVSMADLPAAWGLGSPTSFTVGVLHALYAFKGQFATPEQLSREAAEIEIGRLKEPVGRQDPVIAAQGGFQFMQFMPDDSVRVDPMICPVRTLDRLLEQLLLVRTPVTRGSALMLRRVRPEIKANAETLGRVRDQALALREELQKGRAEAIGPMLAESWEYRRTFAPPAPEQQEAYGAALRAGAISGKAIGAGDGSFLLLVCPPAKRQKVIRALKGWKEIPFRFEPEGSKVIYVSN